MSTEKRSFMDTMQEKVLPAVTKFSNYKFIKAMTTGITAPVCATIIGSVIAVLMTPPFPPTATGGFIDAWRAWSAANAGWLMLVYQLTLNSVALYTLAGVSIATSGLNKKRPTTPLVVAMMSFMILAVASDEAGGVMINHFGSTGLFTAILTGYFVTDVLNKLDDSKLKIKLPDSVPPNIADSIGALFNAMLIAAIVIVLRVVLMNTTGKLLPVLINGLFAPLFSASDSVWAVLLYVLLVRFFWFCGLHGGNIAGSVMSPFLTANLLANSEAYAAGQTLPHIFTGAFSSLWTTMGMLPIAITLLLFAKSEQRKAIGRVGVVPALFCIGEPLTFGIPLVLNFQLAIPYFLIFIINGVAAYAATAIGFIGRSFVSVPWTLPHFLQAFLTTMDIKAVLLYFILLAVDIVIMIPFVRVYDRQLLEQEQAEQD